MTDDRSCYTCLYHNSSFMGGYCEECLAFPAKPYYIHMSTPALAKYWTSQVAISPEEFRQLTHSKWWHRGRRRRYKRRLIRLLERWGQ